MERWLRYWRQNAKKILLILAAIVFLIIALRIINQVIKQNKANIKNEDITVTDNHKPTESVISGTSLTENQAENNANFIQEFVQLCMERKTSQAYNLLSDDCKNELYPKIEQFEQNYINKIFTTSNNYKLQLWLKQGNATTYQITYMNGNPLQTGNHTSDENFSDYITVISQNGENKLNLSSLICKEEINNTVEKQGIVITVKNKTIYQEYETYEVQINNQTDKEISLCKSNKAEDICLIDSEKREYSSALNEIPSSFLKLQVGNQETINIKFKKIYTTNSTSTLLQMRSISLNTNQTNEENVNVLNIEIKL